MIGLANIILSILCLSLLALLVLWTVQAQCKAYELERLYAESQTSACIKKMNKLRAENAKHSKEGYHGK